MAKFLNKKERVYDLKLTSYGEYLMSVGRYKPHYYAFFDDNSIVFTKLFDEDCIVTVHSTTGRLIAETQVSDKTSKITDVSEPGLYILRISYINDNKVTVLKLIR